MLTKGQIPMLEAAVTTLYRAGVEPDQILGGNLPLPLLVAALERGWLLIVREVEPDDVDVQIVRRKP